MSSQPARPQERITRLLRPANGSSQPWFCSLGDGSVWLVKFAGAGPGREALLAEHIAGELGRAWGLPIPSSRPVWLDPSVPRAGTDEFWDVLHASEGWNLAIREIPDVIDVVPTPDMDGAALDSMLAFDRLLANWDRTTQSRNLLADADGRIWWIDHGSCRFLQHLHRGTTPPLPPNHFLAGSTLEARPLPRLSESSIREALADVPDDWLSEVGRDRVAVANALVEYLRQALAA